MTDTPALLDQLRRWIVDWNPAGKTYANFAQELRMANAELEARVDRNELSAQEMEAYGVIMSMADARGLLPVDEPDDALIGSTRS